MSETVIQEESPELAALSTGGEEALSRLFAMHQDGLAKMVKFRISKQLQARIDESDVIQEGYLEAARQLSAYLDSPVLPPAIWLRRIVRHVLLRHIRFHVDTEKRSIGREYPKTSGTNGETSSMVFAVADSIASPLSYIANQETTNEIWELLNSLEPVEREILCLKQLEGLKFPEIAAEIEMDISAVKRRFQATVIRLRKLATHLA